MAPTLTGEKLKLRGGIAAYPIFVTSDKITPKLIDQFLTAEFELTRPDKSTDGGILPKFYLVTTESMPDPSTIYRDEELDEECIIPPVKTLAVAPTKPFQSPHIGKSVEELLKVCKSHFFRDPFSFRLFVVFDERTARDQKSVLLVEDVHRFKSAKADHLRARAEFGYAAYVLASPNVSNAFLTEGAHHPEFEDPESGDEKEVVYFCQQNTKLLGV